MRDGRRWVEMTLWGVDGQHGGGGDGAHDLEVKEETHVRMHADLQVDIIVWIPLKPRKAMKGRGHEAGDEERVFVSIVGTSI
jgi:hypothetical protein